MCKAKHYTEQLIEIFDKVKNDIEKHTDELTRLQLLEQDFLHAIENKNFNVAEGYKLAKEIKNVRNDRRNVKIELDTLINLKRSFCDKYIHQLKCTYGNILNQDEVLLKQKEEKIYKPRILETIDLKVIVPLNRKVI